MCLMSCRYLLIDSCQVNQHYNLACDPKLVELDVEHVFVTQIISSF